MKSTKTYLIAWQEQKKTMQKIFSLRIKLFEKFASLLPESNWHENCKYFTHFSFHTIPTILFSRRTFLFKLHLQVIKSHCPA